MDDNRSDSHTVLIAIITGVVGLLLGLCAGGLIAGFAGYALGRQAATQGSGLMAPFLAPGPSQPRLAPNPPGAPTISPQQGVLVQDVVAGSPADAAGIQPGDVVTQVDGVALDDNHTMTTLMAQHKPGDRVRITLQRAGATRAR